jgi:hypothetical protein
MFRCNLDIVLISRPPPRQPWARHTQNPSESGYAIQDYRAIADRCITGESWRAREALSRRERCHRTADPAFARAAGTRSLFRSDRTNIDLDRCGVVADDARSPHRDSRATEET